MPENVDEPVTCMLKAAVKGDRTAAAKVLPLVYDKLRALARARLRTLPPGQTLQPTALVHEAYLHLVGEEDPGWDGKGHFFCAASRAMRDLLVDAARRKAALKRGGDRARLSLEAAEPGFDTPSAEILAVDEAVRKLEAEDPRKGQIVNMRYFARMSVAETAAALGLSVATVVRDWRYTRAWLARELNGMGGPGNGWTALAHRPAPPARTTDAEQSRGNLPSSG